MTVDLRSLVVLREAIALGSVSKAAARLRIAQPHVSRLIRTLEVEFGAALLERLPRGVRPTRAGEIVAALADQLVGEIAAVRARVAAADVQIAGTITLGIVGSLALPLAPDIVAATQARYPGIRLKVVDAFSARLHELMLRGQLDLALLYADPRGGVLVQQPLLIEPLGLVSTAPGTGDSLALASLVERALVLPAAPNRLRLLIDGAAAAANIELRVAAEIDSFPVLVRIAASGSAETILPYSAIAPENLPKSVNWSRISPDVERRIVLARSRDRIVTPAMRVLSELIVEQVEAGAGAYRWQPATHA